MTKDEKEFRDWLKTTYGVQEFNNYSGTQTEELAIQFALFKQKSNGGTACECGNTTFTHRHTNWIQCVSCNKIKVLKD